MITVSKDNYTLEVEWIDDNDFPPSLSVVLKETMPNGDYKCYPVMPFMRVRNYDPSNEIYSEEDEMPTEEEARTWLDSYILELKLKTND
jgi:hypothetical protein